jgi:hypothetical protein
MVSAAAGSSMDIGECLMMFSIGSSSSMRNGECLYGVDSRHLTCCLFGLVCCVASARCSRRPAERT